VCFSEGGSKAGRERRRRAGGRGRKREELSLKVVQVNVKKGERMEMKEKK